MIDREAYIDTLIALLNTAYVCRAYVCVGATNQWALYIAMPMQRKAR